MRNRALLALGVSILVGVGSLFAADAAPRVPLQLLGGEQTSLEAYRGRVVVLAFWTLGCRPCLAEMPHLERLHRERTGAGVSLIAVNLDEPRRTSEIKPTLKRYGYTFPVALDPEGQAAVPYNPARATPVTVVLDREGRVRYTHTGFQAGDEVALERAVSRVLAESSASLPAAPANPSPSQERQ